MQKIKDIINWLQEHESEIVRRGMKRGGGIEEQEAVNIAYEVALAMPVSQFSPGMFWGFFGWELSRREPDPFTAWNVYTGEVRGPRDEAEEFFRDLEHQRQNPYDLACELRLVRLSDKGGYPFVPMKIDPGANFFVLALEMLGCTPEYSCQGHPKGFYVAYEGPRSISEAIRGLGGCHCDAGPPGDQIIRLHETPEWNEENRVAALRALADLWMKHLLPPSLHGVSMGEEKKVLSQPVKLRRRNGITTRIEGRAMACG